MAKDYKRPTNINTTEGPIIDRINTEDPLLYINSREQAAKNRLDRGGTGGDGGGGGGGDGGGGEQPPSHPALTYNVWATWWDLPTTVSSNLIYQHQGIVELLRFGEVKTVREPNSTASITEVEYRRYLDMCSRVPKGRRVMYDYYWQNPHYYKTYDDYYKLTSDGTTYTGGVSGYGDTTPLKFQTPWATNSAADTKISFKTFLNRCKTDNVLFDYFWDDTEGYTMFGLGSNNNTYDSTFNSNGIPNNFPTWQLTPDPRMTPAIVSDARFNTVLNKNGRTFAQEVQKVFRDLIDNQSDTRTAEQILSYYTTVTTRQDFNRPWDSPPDIERRIAYYAFESALITYNFGTIRKSCIHDCFTETNFPITKIFQSELAPLSTTEVKFALDMNGHFIPKDEISNYGASPHFYGQNNLFYSYGYHTNPTTDLERYRFSPLGANVSSFFTRAHMSFIQDLQRARAILRSSPTSYESFYPIVTTPSNTFNASRYNEDPGYWYELMYHLCLHGAKFFNVFTEIHTAQEMQAVQTVLDNWKSISGNNHAIPASNSAGNTSTLVERIDLKDAAEKYVISGGYIPSLNKWIWRLTAPPPFSNFVLNDPTQTDLPQNLSIPSGSRGIWIVRSVAGKPNYIPYVASEMPTQINERFFSQIFMSVDSDQSGNARPWDGWSTPNISFFKGNPYPTGTRAFPFEYNPVNPEVSSPWHNLIYHTIIDWYKWGSRSFALYGVFGSETVSWLLAPTSWKSTHTSLTDPEFCPARWKGFKYAIRSVLEGNMTPTTQDTAITEPCNIQMYLSPQRSVNFYRDRSSSYWNSLGSNNGTRDVEYYKKLDEFLNELIEAKGRTANSGKLYVSISSSVRSATPKTLHLHRSVGGYKTDALDLSDWYVKLKLENNGIVHFFESRAEKTITQAQIYGETAGQVGSSSTVQWTGSSMMIGEYWLWFSDPNNNDPNVDNFITNEETPLFFRAADNVFPLVDYSRDPYGTPMTYTWNAQSRTLQYVDYLRIPESNRPFYSYTYSPSSFLWSLYTLSDSMRYFKNISGKKFERPHIVSFLPERFAKPGVGGVSVYHPVYGVTGVNPELNYWRVSPKGLNGSFSPLFDFGDFILDPVNYGNVGGQGWWTTSGISYWDNNIRKSSFNEFINFVDNYSRNFCPVNTQGCSNPEYASTSDVVTINTMGGLFTP